MRKTINAMLVSTLLLAVTAQAGEIFWNANWSAYAVGSILTINSQDVSDDWVLGLYQSTGTNPGEGFNESDLSANFLVSTKVLIDTSGPEFTWAFGIEGTLPTLDNNIPIYSVLFNTTDGNIFTTTPSSYSYLVLDDLTSAAFDSGTEGPGFGGDHPYNVSSIPSGNAWVAVPEPATAMLLALGGGLAWLVRMKQRMG